MSIQCGWASIDERGRASGGAAGDQTGLEVKVGRWYYFRQNVVLRFKDRAKAKKAAQICRGIANNNKVGYDQNQRTTLYQELARVGWDPARITKPVETDCSAMVAAIVTAAGIKVSKDLWTGNMRSALYGTGAFYLYTGSAYTESDRLLMTGDIILNESSHVIMALEDGPGVSKSTGSTATSSGSSAVKERIKKGQRGLNDLVVAKLVIDGSRGPATRKVGIMAVQAGLNRDFRAGLEVDGSYGPATRGAVSRHPGLYGMSGAYIRAIQCLLYVNGYDPKGVDGHYGPGMKAAVGAYQRAKGLSVDYSVGPKTMLRLVS